MTITFEQKEDDNREKSDFELDVKVSISSAIETQIKQYNERFMWYMDNENNVDFMTSPEEIQRHKTNKDWLAQEIENLHIAYKAILPSAYIRYSMKEDTQ